MPIYEYKCNLCGHYMDALQGINDTPLEECSECSEKGLQRMISAPNFRLSGDGWYETDFKTGDRKNIAEKSKAETDKKDTAQKSSDVKQDKKKEKKKDISSNKD